VQGESDTKSRVHFSLLAYLKIVLVSFRRHAGSFSFQNGLDQLSEDTVFNTQYVFTCDVHVLGWHMAHGGEDDVTFYNMPLEHAHSSHNIAILTVQKL
jgi:hypothetical protein